MTIKLLYPCDRSKVVITSTYQDHANRPGYRGSRANDLGSLGAVKLPIYASQNDGVVIRHGWDTTGYGNESTVEYGGIVRVQNAHMDSLARLSKGDKVNAGDPIGIMGTTGSSSGIHDHWATWLKRGAVWINVDPLDPANGIVMVNSVSELGDVVIPPYPEPPPPAADWSDLPAEPTVIEVTATIGLRVRKEPNGSFARWTFKGDRWIAGAYRDGWIRIQPGWVHSDWVRRV